MKKISRYIIRATIAPFLFGTSVVIFLFLMQFLMKTLDKLVGKGLENVVIFQLIVYNMAWMAILAVPMGILFATLYAFGLLSANHEITVLKASGGSLIKMMLPLLFVGILVSYGLFLYDSVLVPETNYKAKLLMYDIQRKKTILSIEAGQFSDGIDGYTILAREVDTAKNILHFVTIYDKKSAKINRTINAESCEINFSEDMSKLIFHLKNGEIHQSENDKLKNYRFIEFADYTINTTTSGFGFERSEEGSLNRSDREMSIKDMQKIIAEAEISLKNHNKNLDSIIENQLIYLTGKSEKPENNLNKNTKAEAEKIENKNYFSRNRFSNMSQFDRKISQFIHSFQNSQSNIKQNKEKINQYNVEIHKKYAIPFACLIFILIGCPLGIITKGGNFGLSAAITLVFYIFYWVCLIGGERFADRGIINPALSMWLGNIVIGIVGIFLTLKVNNETISISLPKFHFLKKKATKKV
jgi:lipopolysaccharide export system permease protein